MGASHSFAFDPVKVFEPNEEGMQSDFDEATLYLYEEPPDTGAANALVETHATRSAKAKVIEIFFMCITSLLLILNS